MMGRRGGFVAMAGAAVLVLSGCSAASGGDAATSSEFRITQAEVGDEVAAVLEAMGQPPAEPPAGMALATVQRMVQAAVVTGMAAELGVRVSEAEVQAGTAQLAEGYGGPEQLRDAALQAGIPPESIGDAIRTNLTVAAIGAELDAQGDAQAQQVAAQQALVAHSEAIGVEVAPRYGAWDDATLSIIVGSTVAEPASAPPVAP